MIQELNIKNLAVIEDTTLSFESGYVALVGETGAGKSLIVNSLLLLAGERCDTSLVRDKEKKASVSAVFELEDDFISLHPEVKEYLEGHTLVLRRVINPDKTSRCYLNDEPLSLNTYRTVLSHLIDIHSQGAKSDILDETRQVVYLDQFGRKDLLKAKKEFQVSYQKMEEKQKELSVLIEENKEYDPEYLEFQIHEIKKYDLKPNEIEDLNQEYLNSRDFARLQTKYEDYKRVLSTPESSLDDLLSHAISKLNTFADTELANEAKEARGKCLEAYESLHEFSDTFRSLQKDPKRLDEINQRLFDLKGLQRKYGKTTSEILSKLKEYEEKLSFSKNFEERKTDLEKEIASLREETLKKALTLSQKRHQAATQLEERIGKEMSLLGLRKNGFHTAFTEVELNHNGTEHVSFEVCLNEGLGYAPLAKAASGGESSRLMLALKAVLSALDPYDVLVFDEIDTGVSGKQASLIAHEIQDISDHGQVIVISHLPQVVASSSSAVYIRKVSEKGVTKTVASPFDESKKQEFIARMLSGETVTSAALEQAGSLMKEFERK